MGDESEALNDWSDEGAYYWNPDKETNDFSNSKEKFWGTPYSRGSRRRGTPKKGKPKATVTSPIGKHTQEMVCHCGNHYFARSADLKRGWGKSCSKRCAAVRREFGKPAATPYFK